MANRVPSWANYRQADISAESCATCIFMLDDGDCSRFDGHPPVKRTYTCDEWMDVNQVGKDHLDIDVDVDEQNPDPKYRAEPEHTAMESAFDRELWWDAMEGLEPTFRGVHAGPRNADMQKAAADHGDGAMICLYPTRDAQEALAVPGGLAPEDIHLTLVFLGPAATISVSEFRDIDRRLTEVAQETAPLSGRVSGGGSFAGDGETVPVYATPSVLGLRNLRSKFADLSASEFPFRPHITRAYVTPGDEDSVPEPLAIPLDFDAIHLKMGEKIRSYPLTGAVRKNSVFLVSQDLTAIAKAQAMRATLTLRVGRIHTHPDGQRSYGMFSREGRYVGRTQPTNKRAIKGDTLSLDAAHFTLDPQGDSFWVSPVVTGQSPDAPHSWRELEALAGVPEGGLKGEVEMDAGPAADLVPGEDTNNSYSAPGPAGDIPLPGDDYNAQDQINQSFEGVEYDPVKSEIDKDGPTLSQVHVNAPMENISVSYATTAKRNKMLTLLPVRKADIPKQIVYGVVLEPNVLDTQQDFMRAEEIEKTAHGYLKKAIRGKSSVSRKQHGAKAFFKDRAGIVPVESFIAPCDFTYDGVEQVKKGTWVIAMHFEDAKEWEKVLDGTYTGFSIGGSGIRQEMQLPPDVVDGHQWMTSEPSDWFPQATYTG